MSVSLIPRKNFIFISQFCSPTEFVSILFSFSPALFAKTSPFGLDLILFCPPQRPCHCSVLIHFFTIIYLYVNILYCLSLLLKKPQTKKPRLLKFHIPNCLPTPQTVLAHSLKILSLFRSVYLHLTLFLELLVLPLERICVLINSGHSCSHYALKCASSYSFYSLGIFGRHI